MMKYRTSIESFPDQTIKEWMEAEDYLSYSKNQMIIRPDREKNFVYLILEGQVSAFNLNPDGKECIIGVLRPGDFLQLFDIFTEDNSQIIGRALVDSKILKIEKATIHRIIENSPQTGLRLLEEFSIRAKEMSLMLSLVAYSKVEERLVFLLNKLADSSQEKEGYSPILIDLTHQELAGMIGSTRETTTSILNRLEDKKLLVYKNNKLHIKSK